MVHIYIYTIKAIIKKTVLLLSVAFCSATGKVENSESTTSKVPDREIVNITIKSQDFLEVRLKQIDIHPEFKFLF